MASPLPISDNTTVVSPLTGATQSPFYETHILNTEYSTAILGWIQGGALSTLRSNYASGNSQSAAVLDQLVSSLTAASGDHLPAINTPNVHIRVSALASAKQPGNYQVFSTGFPTAKLNTAVQTTSPYVETVFHATDGSAASVLSRSHINDIFEVVVFVLRTPSTTYTENRAVPVPAVVPEPSAEPIATFDCLPDDSSSSECDNAYGYNYSWGMPFPICNSTDGWGLL